MKLRSQKGFTLIEGLLSIIAIALIVFVGYYVYNTQHKASSTLDKAIKTSSQSTAQVPVAHYLTIKELGIKLKLNADTNNVTYTAFQDQSAVSFTDPNFTQAVNGCNQAQPKQAQFFATLTKINGTYDPNSPPSDVFSHFVKQLDGFYLTYGNPDGGFCYGDNVDQSARDKTDQLFTKLNTALESAAKEAQQL